MYKNKYHNLKIKQVLKIFQRHKSNHNLNNLLIFATAKQAKILITFSVKYKIKNKITNYISHHFYHYLFSKAHNNDMKQNLNILNLKKITNLVGGNK
jgi:ribosome-associated toxin RatA of RatAB toxin-antitoxin module